MNLNIFTTKQTRISTTLIIALIILTNAWIINLLGIISDESLITKLFLIFIGVILAVQVLPGLILICALIKGLNLMSHKRIYTKESNR